MLFKSDRKYDKNQATIVTKKNEQLSSVVLMKLRDMILSLVQPGQGIRVERRGERVFIHATGGVGRGVAAGGGVSWYEAPTKAGLENDNVSRRSFGQVVGEGTDNGMFCIRNPANDGWDAINFLE